MFKQCAPQHLHIASRTTPDAHTNTAYTSSPDPIQSQTCGGCRDFCQNTCWDPGCFGEGTCGNLATAPPTGPGGLCPEGTPTFGKEECCPLFNTLKQFSIDLVKTLNAESDASEFSAVAFSTTSEIATTTTTPEGAVAALKSIVYAGGLTNHKEASEFLVLISLLLVLTEKLVLLLVTSTHHCSIN